MLSDTGSPVLDLAARIAATHHERYDGTGYPLGLRGDAVPLEGMIAAVADVFDAVTTDRVYRPAMTLDEGFALIRAGRGTEFAPAVADAFLAAEPQIRLLHERLADVRAEPPLGAVPDVPPVADVLGA
jgi:putative two-component system response regulator